MGKTDMSEVVEEVSDWDDPMDVAVLLLSNEYSSSSNRNKNDEDHKDVVVVRWRPDVMCDLKRHFPMCYLVCDGVAAMKMGRMKSSSSLSDHDINDGIVRFKYNGIVFELSTSCIADKTSESVWWWPTTLSWSSLAFSSPTSAQKKETTSVLAQDRIRYALKLGHMKILSKGKVLYNSETTTNNNNNNDPSTISEQLLDTTKSDIMASSSSSSPSSSTKKIKTSLTVMGTALGKELKEPTNGKNQAFSFNDILSSPFKILLFTARISWLLIQSFLSPFISGISLPSSSQDGSENGDSFDDQDGTRRRRTARPHQD